MTNWGDRELKIVFDLQICSWKKWEILGKIVDIFQGICCIFPTFPKDLGGGF